MSELSAELLFETRGQLADLAKEVTRRDHATKNDLAAVSLQVQTTSKDMAVILERVKNMESAFGAMRTALYGAATAVVVGAMSIILFAHA